MKIRVNLRAFTYGNVIGRGLSEHGGDGADDALATAQRRRTARERGGF